MGGKPRNAHTILDASRTSTVLFVIVYVVMFAIPLPPCSVSFRFRWRSVVAAPSGSSRSLPGASARFTIAGPSHPRRCRPTGPSNAHHLPFLCLAFTVRFRRALFLRLWSCDIVFTGKASWLASDDSRRMLLTNYNQDKPFRYSLADPPRRITLVWNLLEANRFNKTNAGPAPTIGV